jgi:hypothetical protein
MELDDELAAHTAALTGTVAASSGIIADIVAGLCALSPGGEAPHLRQRRKRR